MKVAVPAETLEGERRVALTPDTVGRIIDAGFEILIESGAGLEAKFPDEAYAAAGAMIVSDASRLYSQAGLVLKVQRPDLSEVSQLPEGSALICFLEPLTNPDLVSHLAERKITAFTMDAVPRIARAQRMDAMSSMASLAGYKAVLMAANSLAKFFPMMITAAGTMAPAKGLVLGAGVAGLQAIATARRLGAVMYAYDVRPAVKEQVESLGANFIELETLTEDAEQAGGYARELPQETQQRLQELVHHYVRDMDFIITTAAVPGRKAPVLVTENMVKDMRPGSVIVDLSAGSGGNCELTQPGADVLRHGITVHGPLNLPSSMASHASQMYSRNISSLLLHLVKDGDLDLDFEDEITRECCVTHQGKILHDGTQELTGSKSD